MKIDAYGKCRRCIRFGTTECPESSLCFALNYKPFFKAKPKMKKKYRKAICNSLIWLIKPFWWLFLIIAFPFVAAWMLLSDWDSWLCEKFKTYNYDD